MSSSEHIKITLPDGTVLERPGGTTGLDIAEGISSGLAKQSILVELNGKLRDLSYPINEDSSLKILKRDAEEALELIRHDCAHVMAEAVQELYQELKLQLALLLIMVSTMIFQEKLHLQLMILIRLRKKCMRLLIEEMPL